MFVVVAGGMGSLAGPIVGAIVYVLVDRLVAGYLGTGELALGIFAVLIILLLPRGLMGWSQTCAHAGATEAALGRGPSRSRLGHWLGVRLRPCPRCPSALPPGLRFPRDGPEWWRRFSCPGTRCRA